MDSQHRKVLQAIEPQPVVDGAGVKIQRSIATRALDNLDPFLLFDHFGSDNPEDYLAGFPMHPHRGIETVTYVLEGVVNHRDSLGNSGTIYPGDVQWLTAGRGVLHEEMPQSMNGKMNGFQFWVNLPSQAKMTPPRYQNIPSWHIPEISLENGVKLRIIAGTVGDVTGPVTDSAVDPLFLDVQMPSHSNFTQPTPAGHPVFAYLYEGQGAFGVAEMATGRTVSGPRLVNFADGDWIGVRTANSPVRFLLIMGKPLNEPIARYGPFVMNTHEEIQQTLRDLEEGSFVQ